MSPTESRRGRIIFLNGTSSSGKTSIGKRLMLVLDTPYFHIAVDAITDMRAKRRTQELGDAELAEVLGRTRAGFHRAVAGMAAAGNDVVMDYVLSERWRLLDCLEVLAGFDVFFVGVRCSLEELNRREQLRDDRDEGLAASQLAQVHAHACYDVECDTTATSAHDCALRIKEFVCSGNTPTAFAQLRATFLPHQQTT